MASICFDDLSVQQQHTHLTAFWPGQPGQTDTKKARTIWILLKQETASGSVISWTIRKSAPHSRHLHLTAGCRDSVDDIFTISSRCICSTAGLFVLFASANRPVICLKDVQLCVKTELFKNLTTANSFTIVINLSLSSSSSSSSLSPSSSSSAAATAPAAAAAAGNKQKWNKLHCRTSNIIASLKYELKIHRSRTNRERTRIRGELANPGTRRGLSTD